MIKKERNFLVWYDENDNYQGKWDIHSGMFYTSKDMPTHTRPTTCRLDRSFFSDAISFFNQRKRGWNENRGQQFEKLISVGLLPWDVYALDEEIVLNKNIIQYLKEHCNNYYMHAYISEAKTFILYGNIINELSNVAKDCFLRMVEKKRYPIEYLKIIIKRMDLEKLFDYKDWDLNYNIDKIIEHYYDMSMTMYDKVTVEKNLLSNYIKLAVLYKAYCNDHYDDILTAKNNIPALYYENEDFIITPLLTKNDFHDEATQQHNCVEDIYMKYVFESKTHVVKVRKKSNPNKSYITCEVSNNGHIIQFLCANNIRIKNEQDKQLKNDYQAHLDNTWKRVEA